MFSKRTDSVCIEDKLGDKRADTFCACVCELGREETKVGGGGISEQEEIFGRNGWGGWRYWQWQMLSQHDFSESAVGAVIGGRAHWPCLTSAATLARVRIRLFVCGRIPRACAKGC